MAVELNDEHPNLGLVIGETIVGVTPGPEGRLTAVTSLGKVFEFQGQNWVRSAYTSGGWVRLA